jgi:hypothetical protein
MLIQAVAFWQVILAVHIVAVVAAFGVTFAYSLFGAARARLDPHAMPWFHRTQQMIGQRLVNPGLAIVLITGIYLASDLHQWKTFYVQWGLGAVVVLGALEGALVIRSERRLATLAERDIAASSGGEVKWSAEYEALIKRVSALSAAMSLLTIVTVYLMTVQAGA